DLLRFSLRACRRDLWVVLLLGLAGGVLGMVTPIATGIIIDTIIPGAQRNQLLLVVLGLVVSTLAGAFFQPTRSVAMLGGEGRMEGTGGPCFRARLLSPPVRFFRQYTTGDLATRALGISTIHQVLTGATVSSLLSGVFSLFNFALLFYYDVWLALAAS